MSDPATQKRIDRGLAWVSMAASIVAVLDILGLGLILHVWVSQEDFGTISSVVTLFGVLTLAGELGLPAAAIQRPLEDDDRLSTLYWLGIASGVGFYAVVWLAAPLLAAAHGEPLIQPLFRVGGLILLVRPFHTTHNALLRRQLRFRELSLVRVIANAADFAAKVGSAMAGLGLWCFVIAPIVRESVLAIGTPLIAGWRPRRVFRPRGVGADIRFGLRATGSELIFLLYSNLDYQVVSFQFGAAALGMYRAAYELVLEPVRFVSGIVTAIAFPTFSRLRQDRGAMVDQFVAFTRQNLVVVLVTLSVLLVTAGDALTVLLGPAYAPAADAARVLAVVGVLRAVSHLGPPLLDGVGRPDLTLRYQTTAALLLGGLFVAMSSLFGGLGFFSVALAWAIGYPFAFALLAWMVCGQLGITPGAYLRRVGRIPLLVVVAAAVGFGVHAACAGLSPGLRLAAAAATVVIGSLALLAAAGELSLRKIVGALR